MNVLSGKITTATNIIIGGLKSNGKINNEKPKVRPGKYLKYQQVKREN
jgi:hypothetical protein